MLQLQWAEPLYLPVTWQWSLTLLSRTSNNLSHIQHLWLDWNTGLSDMTKFLLKCFFYHSSAITILFKNCFNESINYIFSSVKSNWLAKFIINKTNLKTKLQGICAWCFSVHEVLSPLSLLLSPFTLYLQLT